MAQKRNILDSNKYNPDNNLLVPSTLQCIILLITLPFWRLPALLEKTGTPVLQRSKPRPGGL